VNVTKNKIAALIKRLKRAKKKIVFTNGVFDILHRGHVEYLAKAKSYGDVLIVGMNSDASVRRLKGPPRPIQKLADRAAILMALEAVDYVIPFGEETPARLIEKVRPDVLVKGADYKINEIVGAEFVRSYGGKVRRVKLSPGRASSRILEKLMQL
jgi:D-beta-D-heptose 7-phosphate kinase/D-beta-D-heptose 1-phosphate adenosyltransferase